ncbi:hypothetical protein FKR81_18485 [Lentzea tibetensis]|uniref:Uncharacterized protein n=1 Tax=Lentzea tibetensis TaxID=2591470 RepID=A0A563ESY4_9PSEU|nr:NAD(P)-binding protein [Lentzea tibetensis]TWP50611.1 hypothetical protein FKR81_18485 [Lentzea tibetensis]
MPSALVVGASVAGLVTAYRLARSGWDVVIIDSSVAPPEHHVVPTGPGLEAARRMHIPPLGELRDKLAIRCGTSVRAQEPDRFGVTVTFSSGDDEWFDLVVDTAARFGRLDDSLAIYAAELLGDAFDIFRDFGEALSWWDQELHKVT